MAQATRVFRVFVSSTFTDFKAERNALQRRVFPELRAFCADRGYGFQAIDLRWGIGQEASLDQRTMRVCLDELARCQKMSPRPNFIVLIGDRYGWRPLPEEIPADEYSAIHLQVEDNVDKELLNSWYQADANAVPTVYRLKARTGRYADYSDEDHARQSDTLWRDEIETPLRRVLLGAVTQIELDEQRRAKYVASATEQEIINGLTLPNAGEHVFCFLRTIEKIDELPWDEATADFADFTLEKDPDQPARTRVAGLRGDLDKTLGQNAFSYEAHWTGSGVSLDHIDRLCNDVEQSLKGVIGDEIEKLTGEPAARREAAAHEAFGHDLAEVFVGREDMRRVVAGYIAGDDPHPFAVYGEGGCGKSALIAVAAADARAAHPDALVVARFVGATPASSDGRQLLQYVCSELAEAAGDGEVPTDYEELVQQFPERLERAAAERPLVLFLDSLDQLSAVNNANSLTWLPGDLPANVRLVLTTRPDEHLKAVEGKVPGKNLVELGDMSAEEGAELLDEWLRRAEPRRTLQPAQRDEVLGKFAACALPLYLRLAFQEARLWPSWVAPADLGPDVQSIIRDLYARLADEHGQKLVAQTLAYLAAGRDRSGLSETELLDALSADHDVLAEFEQRSQHKLPEQQEDDAELGDRSQRRARDQRLPIVIWARLYADLEPYLGTRISENTVLLTFYHRELADVAEQDYLAQDRAARHRVLAEVLRRDADPRPQEPWNGTARALAELPYHLTRAELWDEVFAALTDFSFLEKKAVKVAVVEHHDGDGEVKTVYTGALALLEDYDRALAVFPAD